jgi:hypothetical protein
MMASAAAGAGGGVPVHRSYYLNRRTILPCHIRYNFLIDTRADAGGAAMATRRTGRAIQHGGTAVTRRGLLAGAAAVVAGLIAQRAAQTEPVAADGATWTLPYSGTLATGSTLIYLINGGTGMALFGNSGSNIGLYGSTSAASGAGMAGVFGYGGNTDNFGVWGSSPNGYGVYGLSQTGVGYGVYGTSTGGHAIAGNLLAAPGSGYAGVFGYGNGSGTDGVWGTNLGSGTGVFGSANTGNGVYGSSLSGYGVLGYTTGGAASLSGISTNVNIPAFAGGNSAPGGLAAHFDGLVYVNGRLVVVDPSYKSGLLAHPDGSHRLVYCVESPESWIEDFGRGTLVSGKADVKLDPDFAAVVQTGDYHISLTPYDGVGALRAARQTATGFAVEEIGGTSNGSFSYRVVAKPKTEKKLGRLEKFVPPEVKLPDPASLPRSSAQPAPTPSKTPPGPQPAPPPRP